MKPGLSLKLGIVVIALFALVITGCLLYAPLRLRYWRGRLSSENAGERENAVNRILALKQLDLKPLVRDFVRVEGEPKAAIATILKKKDWTEFDLLDYSGFIDFANALMTMPGKDDKPREYLGKVRSHLFALRPHGRNDKYYDFLYRFCKYDYYPLEGGAVLAGLRFQDINQAPDGRWFSEDGKRDGDLLITGLCILSYSVYGQTHKVGRFTKSVKSGLEYLIGSIDSEGSFSRSTFTHAVCAWSLAEFYAVTRDVEYKKPAEKAIRNLVSRQLPDGGFPEKTGDNTSDFRSTCYSVLALKIAKIRKLETPEGIFEKILAYIDGSVELPDPSRMKISPITRDEKEIDASGEVKDSDRIELSDEELTRIAMTVQCGVRCGRKVSHPRIKKAGRILRRNTPYWEGRRDAEYLYWGTYAQFQIGGELWRNWNRCMKKTLLKTQRAGRFYLDGSWDPVMGLFSEKYGRMYTTVMNVLTLNIYYIYARTDVSRRLQERIKQKQ